MDKEVKAKLDTMKNDLFLLCMANKIPMFFTYAEETEGGTVYESSVVTPHETRVALSNDKITKFSAALNKNFELRFKTHIKTEDAIEDAMSELLDDEEAD